MKQSSETDNDNEKEYDFQEQRAGKVGEHDRHEQAPLLIQYARSQYFEQDVHWRDCNLDTVHSITGLCGTEFHCALEPLQLPLTRAE